MQWNDFTTLFCKLCKRKFSQENEFTTRRHNCRVDSEGFGTILELDWHNLSSNWSRKCNLLVTRHLLNGLYRPKNNIKLCMCNYSSATGSCLNSRWALLIWVEPEKHNPFIACSSIHHHPHFRLMAPPWKIWKHMKVNWKMTTLVVWPHSFMKDRKRPNVSSFLDVGKSQTSVNYLLPLTPTPIPSLIGPGWRSVRLVARGSIYVLNRPHKFCKLGLAAFTSRIS